MKTKILTLALFAFLFANETYAQDVTTVNAKNSDISDNLDLRAVASIFGDSENLEDFERRLNDPKNQISNLDLNYDRQVDYLRVIESVERNTHLIILQAVLEKDVFQDVATIEVERDSNNNVQVQVVGDVYMYGSNYIYEPVYVSRPIIYNVFWADVYRPYYSPYYWNYYPSYYYGWAPYPVYRYRNHIHVHIHQHNTYNYVNVRRSDRAVAMHSTRRSNGYERQYPNQSFTRRNNNVANRYELDRTRNVGGTRTAETRNSGTRNANTTNATRNKTLGSTRGNNAVRTNTTPVRSEAGSVRSNNPVRATKPTRNESGSVRTTAPTRVQSENVRPANTAPTRTQPVRSETRSNTATPTRNTTPTVQPQRSTPARSQSVSQPQRSQRSESGNSNNSEQRGSGRR
ncbi:hypothetical protein ACI6PS_14800 [Flavobacterium sp. PLA-1-15]|uniref:hypothetical protein n=1 Tax=Flavobacterium sp. PLA-1-15 TaxID=3380533 RepID=UPI003B823A79